jgi:hypothetical protein
VKRILGERQRRVTAPVTEKRPLLDRVSEALLEKKALEVAESRRWSIRMAPAAAWRSATSDAP